MCCDIQTQKKTSFFLNRGQEKNIHKSIVIFSEKNITKTITFNFKQLFIQYFSVLNKNFNNNHSNFADKNLPSVFNYKFFDRDLASFLFFIFFKIYK